MKVAFDNQALHSGHAVRGIGVMVDEQISSLEKEADRTKEIDFKVLDFSKNDLSKYDVVHYPYFFPYTKTFPPKKLSRYEVVTIQDLIQLIYPEVYPSGVRGKLNFFWQKMRLREVDSIITISETSKKDIVRFLNIPTSKIEVVYLAPKKKFKKIFDQDILKAIRLRYELPRKFVLYVGDVNYNKNVSVLVDACKFVDIPLVIVGKQAKELGGDFNNFAELNGPQDYFRYLFNKPHPEKMHLTELSEKIKKNGVITLGYLPIDDLVGIYNLASVYCQPSLYEGFGFPVLESFACETPVVISKTQALVEVAGGACLIANTNDPKDFAEKINTLLFKESVKLHCIRSGKERLKKFSWNITAKKTADIYRNLVG